LEPNRPPLRVVAPDESPPEPVAAPVIPPATPLEVTKEHTAYLAAVDATDATSPLRAAYLICDGAYLADAAISFYHSAVAHAPVGTFRHDIPPGLKSAEATRAWIGTHLVAIKAMIPDESKTICERAKDLKQAATLAASELQRAHATAKGVGMNFDDRYATALKEAALDLAAVRDFVPPKAPVVEDAYEIGAFVLGNSL